MTKGQDAIRRLFDARHDTTGNPPSLPAVFPDQLAPVVRTTREGERELTLMRWASVPARYIKGLGRSRPERRCSGTLAWVLQCIVSQRRDSPYRSGRFEGWRKILCPA